MSWQQALTELGAAVGAAGTITQGVRGWLGRRRIVLEVDWDHGDDSPGDERSPRIVMRNLGSQTIHIVEVLLRWAKGEEHRIDDEERSIVAGGRSICRPVWRDYPPDEVLSFEHDWRSLHVVVRDGRGKEWRSDRPAKRPSWFTIAAPYAPPGLSRLPW